MMDFADVSGWESWLAGHHDAEGGVWLRIAKKSSGVVSVTAGQALEVALCHGWIDSHRRLAWPRSPRPRRTVAGPPRTPLSAPPPVPPDLAEALAERPEAAARFAALDRTGRYRIILPLLKARTPAGRAARLQRALLEIQPVG